MIVPFAAGGPTDVMARLIAQKLSESLKQQFYVENHPGAGGNIGMTIVARANPDGYTMLVASSSFVVNPSLYAKNPYDAFKDFAPVTLAAASPNILVVNPELPVKTVKELVDLLKANPYKYAIANPGIGTTPQLAAELFKLSLKLEATSVPFGGAAPAIQSTVANQTPIAFAAMPPAAPQVNGGKLRALAVTSARRSTALPDVPTLGEAGIAEQEFGDHAGRAAAGEDSEGDRRSAQRRDQEGDGAARREGQMRPTRLRLGGGHAGGILRLHQERGRQVGQGDHGSEDSADQIG